MIKLLKNDESIVLAVRFCSKHVLTRDPQEIYHYSGADYLGYEDNDGSISPSLKRAYGKQ